MDIAVIPAPASLSASIISSTAVGASGRGGPRAASSFAGVLQTVQQAAAQDKADVQSRETGPAQTTEAMGKGSKSRLKDVAVLETGLSDATGTGLTQTLLTATMLMTQGQNGAAGAETVSSDAGTAVSGAADTVKDGRGVSPTGSGMYSTIKDLAAASREDITSGQYPLAAQLQQPVVSAVGTQESVPISTAKTQLKETASLQNMQSLAGASEKTEVIPTVLTASSELQGKESRKQRMTTAAEQKVIETGQEDSPSVLQTADAGGGRQLSGELKTLPQYDPAVAVEELLPAHLRSSQLPQTPAAAAEELSLSNMEEAVEQGGSKKSATIGELLARTNDATILFSNRSNSLTAVEEGQTTAGMHTNAIRTSDPEQVIHQIVDKARLQQLPLGSQMVIQLKPEHLGDVMIKIAVEGDLVSASFHASKPEVRALLEAALPQMKQDLAQATGLKIDQVGVYAGLGQFFSDSQQEQRQNLPQLKFPNRNADEEFQQAMETVNSNQETANNGGVDYRI